jgi:hypothetical protein
MPNLKKTALIGNGYWGSKIKKYIPEFFELKYVIGSKFDKNIIWKDKEINSVIVATPIETHYEIVKEALQNGKHVFSEKPITLHTDQAEELKQLAANNGLFIGVNYTQTFSHLIVEALKWINTIGGIEYVEMSTKHLGRFMNFDVYWLLAAHHLSILDMFINLDDLIFKFEDHLFNNGLCTTGSILFDNGRIDVSTNFSGKEMLINFYGIYGSIKYRPIKDKLEITLYDKKYGLLPNELIKKELIIKFDESNNLRYAIKYFKDLINNKVESNIESAIKMTKILESNELQI